MGESLDDDSATPRDPDPSDDSSSSGPLTTVRHAILTTLERAPLESLIVVTCAVLASAQISGADFSEQFLTSWWMTSFTVVTAVLGTTLLYEFDTIDRKARWGISTAYLAGGALYGVFLLAPRHTPELYRWVLLTGGVGLAVFLTPLAARLSIDNRRRLVSQFAVRFLKRLALSGAFCIAGYLGIAGALAAIQELFDVGIPSELYMYTATWLLAVAAPITLLAGLRDMTDEEPYSPGDDALRWMCHLGNWLFLPLSALYLAILYVYEIDVLITGDAPRNLLSPLALGAAIVVIVMLFLLNVLRYTDRGQPLVQRLEWLPVAYLPIIPMPLWAVAVRIQQHGWTEFRYVRILAALGVAIAFGYATYRKLRGRAFSIQALPATFAVMCMLASFGPWGVVAVSKSSQQSMLRHELQQAGALKNGQVHPLSKDEIEQLDPSLIQNIHSRADYLDDKYGRHALAPIADSTALKSDPEQLPLAALGLPRLSKAYGSGTSPTRGDNRHTDINETYADIKFHHAQRIPVGHHVQHISTFDDITHEKGSHSVQVTATDDSSPTYRADLQPLIDAVQQRLEDGKEADYGNSIDFRDLPEGLASFPITGDTDHTRGTVVFRDLWIEQPRNNSGQMHMTSAEGELLLAPAADDTFDDTSPPDDSASAPDNTDTTESTPPRPPN